HRRRGAGARVGVPHRRPRAPDPRHPPRAAGRPVLPRWPSAPQGGVRADARPHGLREPDGGGGVMKKIETTSAVLLKHHLTALKLPTMTAECEKVAARCAKENVDHLGFLLQLCELELLDRERRGAARRLEAARLPTRRGLDGFDFTAALSVNKPLILELMRCEYIDRRENVILVGGSGSGKTHLATALATEACTRGKRVRFFRVTELATLLLEAREERQLARLRS